MDDEKCIKRQQIKFKIIIEILRIRRLRRRDFKLDLKQSDVGQNTESGDQWRKEGLDR